MNTDTSMTATAVEIQTATAVHDLDVLLMPDVPQAAPKKKAGRKKFHANATDRKRAQRKRERIDAWTLTVWDYLVEDYAEIGITLPDLPPAADLKPPTTKEPQYPIKTGDEIVDAANLAQHQAEVKALMEEWAPILDATNDMNRGSENLVTGGYDIEHLQRVAHAHDRKERGRRVRPAKASD
jgi:hypothetical protein